MPGSCLRKPEEGVGSPGTGVTDSSEQPLGSWASDPGTLEEQPVSNLSSPRSEFLKSGKISL